MHRKANLISPMAGFSLLSVSASVASGTQTQGNLKVVHRYVLFAAMALALCAPARADIIWDWSYSSNQFTGSGTLTTDSTLTSGTYEILDISGTMGTRLSPGVIQLLFPPNTYLSNDNLLGPSQPQLDSSGLAFSTLGSGPYFNISYVGLGNYKAQDPTIADNGQGTFSAVMEIPEPATAVLIVPTLLAFALFVRCRNVKVRKTNSGKPA